MVIFIHELKTMDNLLKQRGKSQDLEWEDLASGLGSGLTTHTRLARSEPH